jgi:DoxX-like protein
MSRGSPQSRGTHYHDIADMGIYVEIFIRGAMDELWEKTQNPGVHQRWDLRFSEIEYLPRAEEEPQKFLYATRIGAGVRIVGAGESIGEHDDASGQRTSALRFWSADPKSLIETGSGYWKYIPSQNGIVFLTGYDYRVRFGALGRLTDSIGFRPLLGWATAWSFDRLRLWIESGIPPEVSRKFAIANAVSRSALAFVWIYQGLVPKILYRDAGELGMLRDAGLLLSPSSRAPSIIGAVEICFGLAMLVLWRQRWPLWCTILAMGLATGVVALFSPRFLTAAFNPVALNVSVAALAAIGLLTARYTPTATNCRRRPQRRKSDAIDL